jgi:hypothetical protein
LAIPLIQNRHGLARIQNTVSNRQLLYTGNVVYDKDKPCALFLMADTVIMRMITTGESTHPATDMFDFLGECYIYTATPQNVVQASSGLVATEIADVDRVPLNDRCADKKLFLLS